MVKLSVRALETEGFAIVKATSAEQLRLEYETFGEIETTSSWGDFRTAGHPFAAATEVIERDCDVEDYIAAVESANGLDPGGGELAERWERACQLTAGPADGSDVPTDDTAFRYQHGEYGAALGWSIALQATMLQDLPDEVLDEFDLVYESTLDGTLGMVPSDQLDTVCARLVELGFEF